VQLKGDITMSALTGICITLGCFVVAMAIAVLIEERNERRRQLLAARAEKARRWHEMQAIAKLMQEQRDENFEQAQWYEYYEDGRDSR
jgi:hypothetical protein